MGILHCDLSHENVASYDQARISACATCFRLALSLRVTRCGHVPATFPCDLSLGVSEPFNQMYANNVVIIAKRS